MLQWREDTFMVDGFSQLFFETVADGNIGCNKEF